MSGLKAAKGDEYAPFAHYQEFAEWYSKFAMYIAMKLCVRGDRQDPQIKQMVTRNFVARCAVSLHGVMALWKVNAYADCWVLYRGILDRLFHLHHLNRTDSFAEYDEWCFLQQYNARNAVRSAAEFKGRIDPEFFRDTPEQKDRAQSLQRKGTDWSRPYPEQEAKAMGLLFLYRHGYDYASTHVHPMANDGQQDYTTLTGNGGPWPDQIVAVNNACLAALLLLKEAMKGDPNRRWRGLVSRCMDEALSGLRTGDKTYLQTFVDLGHALPDGDWCSSPGAGLQE